MEKVKQFKFYSTVFSIYYIYHNPVGREDKKISWIVNMIDHMAHKAWDIWPFTEDACLSLNRIATKTDIPHNNEYLRCFYSEIQNSILH